MSLAPILLNAAIEAYSWRTAWLLAAAAVWLIVIPIGYFGIIDRPADVSQYPDGEAEPPDSGVRVIARSHSRREAVGEVRFWLLSAAVATTAMLVTAMNFHQISILGAEGLSSTEAAAMFLPQIAGAIVAGLVMGALADKVAARYLLAASMALLVAALLLVGVIQPGWQVVLYSVTLGAAAGGQRPIAATVLPRWFGLANIGAIQGIATFVAVGASAAGPLALSLTQGWLGSYSTAAFLLALVPLGIGAAVLAIAEPEPAPPVRVGGAPTAA